MRNMKMLRRFGAAMIAFVMAFSLAMPAFAATGDSPATYDLTINGVVKNATYKVYPLFSLADTKTSDGKDLYVYTVNENAGALADVLVAHEEFGYVDHGKTVLVDEAETPVCKESGAHVHAGFARSGNNLMFVLVSYGDDGSQVTDDTPEARYQGWEASAAGTKYKNDLSEYLNKNANVSGLTPTTYRAVEKASDEAPVGVTEKVIANKSITIQVPKGYNLIMSNMGRFAMVDTMTGNSMSKSEKNAAPGIEKQVENEYGEWVSMTDAAFGEQVHFRVIIDAGTGLEKLKFVDKLPDGLRFDLMDYVRFYPRNAEGVAAIEGDTSKNRVVSRNSRSETDLSSSITEMHGNNVKMIGLDRPNWDLSTPVNDTGMAVASRDGNTITVEFLTQWLKSLRMNEENWDAELAPDGTYDQEPIWPFDHALTGKIDLDDTAKREAFEARDTEYSYGFDYTGKLYNMYLGDMMTTADDGGKIVISYYATVTDEADIGGEGNTNTAYLEFGDPTDPDHPVETEPVHATAYVYELDVLKLIAGTNTPLPDAEFELRRGFLDIKASWDATKDSLTLDAFDTSWITDDLTGGLEGWVDDDYALTFKHEDNTNVYVYAGFEGYANVRVLEAGFELINDTTKAGYTTMLKSGSDGKIVIQGLDSDIYRLKETKAPAGYIDLDAPVTVIIGGVGSKTADEVDGAVTMAAYVASKTAAGTYEKNSDGVVISVENASGLRMPETGGIGTTIFYVVGGTLVLAAGAVLVIRKRSSGQGE